MAEFTENIGKKMLPMFLFVFFPSTIALHSATSIATSTNEIAN